MKMNWEQHKSGAVLRLTGEFTIDDSESMRRRCRQWMEEARTGLVIECSELERLDSSALETLMWLQEELERRGLSMRIASLQGQPAIAFSVTRLERRFQIHDTIENAARQLAGNRWGGQAA